MSVPNYAGQRVLVTGATGFVGRRVARALAAQGAALVITGRDASALRQVAADLRSPCEVQAVDLATPGEFDRLYRAVQPQVTFNLAGYGVDRSETDSTMMEALNTRLPAEMCEVLAQNPAHGGSRVELVHVGSGFEYGPVDGPVTEESPARPTSDYGRSKLAGTLNVLQASRERGLAAVVARLFVVYGPGEHEARLLPSLLRAKQTGEAVPMTAGQQRRDFTFVDDAVEGLLRLGALRLDSLAATPGVVNVATGTLTSVREFAEAAAEVIGLAPQQLQFGALPYRDDEVAQGPVDTTKLKRLLDWTPQCAIREGIRRTKDA